MIRNTYHIPSVATTRFLVYGHRGYTRGLWDPSHEVNTIYAINATQAKAAAKHYYAKSQIVVDRVVRG
jgi:hypothetical protein